MCDYPTVLQTATITIWFLAKSDVQVAGESGELALRFDKSIPRWKQMRCAIQKSKIIGPPSSLEQNVESSECLYVSFRARDLVPLAGILPFGSCIDEHSKGAYTPDLRFLDLRVNFCVCIPCTIKHMTAKYKTVAENTWN